MFIFRRSRIEAESKSNRNCNSRFLEVNCGVVSLSARSLWYNNARIEVLPTKKRIKCRTETVTCHTETFVRGLKVISTNNMVLP